MIVTTRRAAAAAFATLLGGACAASADYESAREAFDRKEIRTGVAALRAAAHEGDARAQNHLGTLFEDGRYVGRDFRRAIFWYRKSADKGNAEGQLNLGRMYRGGLGVERDERRAVFWYRAAAGQGLAAAQFFLALMYESGRGVDRDLVSSWMWYSLAAEQGDEDARFRRDRLAASFNARMQATAEGTLRGYREATGDARAEAAPAERGTGRGTGGGTGSRDRSGGSRRGAGRGRAGAAGAGQPARVSHSASAPRSRVCTGGRVTASPAAVPVTRCGSSSRSMDSGAGGALTIVPFADFAKRSWRAGRRDPSCSRFRPTCADWAIRSGESMAVPDPRTAAAIEAFQRGRGLPVDGRLTLDLLKVLRGSRS